MFLSPYLSFRKTFKPSRTPMLWRTYSTQIVVYVQVSGDRRPDMRLRDRSCTPRTYYCQDYDRRGKGVPTHIQGSVGISDC